MPASISSKYQGTVKEFQSSFANLTILLAVAILAAKRPDLREKLRQWRARRAEEVLKTDAEAQQNPKG